MITNWDAGNGVTLPVPYDSWDRLRKNPARCHFGWMKMIKYHEQLPPDKDTIKIVFSPPAAPQSYTLTCRKWQGLRPGLRSVGVIGFSRLSEDFL